MPRKKKPTWQPAAEFKTTKLKRVGPKPNQSTDAYIYGKNKGQQEFMDNPKNKFNDLL